MLQFLFQKKTGMKKNASFNFYGISPGPKLNTSSSAGGRRSGFLNGSKGGEANRQ